MTTIKDVARLARVSISTVSAVLNDTHAVTPELAVRVREAVAQLNYTPSATARNLKRGTTRLLGLIVADITNPYFSDLTEAIEAEARRQGYAVILSNSGQDETQEREYLRLMQSHRVDGLLLSISSGTSRQSLIDFRRTNIPTVLIDRSFEDIAYDTVQLDDHAAGESATAFLLSLGHRRIGYVGGPRGLSTSDERLRGFRDALLAAHVPFDEALAVDGGFTIEGGYAATGRLLALPERPSALFSANNLMAIGLMRCVAAAGLRCPEDISVITIDDFPWAEAFRPRLTTVAQPVREIGRRAVRLLVERVEKRRDGPVQHAIFQPQLRVRDSCAPLRG